MNWPELEDATMDSNTYAHIAPPWHEAFISRLVMLGCYPDKQRTEWLSRTTERMTFWHHDVIRVDLGWVARTHKITNEIVCDVHALRALINRLEG